MEKWDQYQDQPDCGGNRHYDYITVEEFEAAEKTLEKKRSWRHLESNEIVVLRQQFQDEHINPDIVDHEDKLVVLRCLLYWVKLAKGNK